MSRSPRRSRSRSPRRSRSRSRSRSRDRGSPRRSRSRSRSRDRGSPGAGNRRIYVGRLPRQARQGDLEDLFARYGRLVHTDLKDGYGFIEFEDSGDAKEAVKALDGHDFEGSKLRVEPSYRGEGKCYTCGKEGHWARDCREAGSSFGGRRGSRRGGGGPGRGGQCYSCGEYGHLARDCRNGGSGGSSRRYSPYGGSSSRHSRRRSRSRSRSRSPRRSRRSPSPVSRRSPSPRRSGSPRNEAVPPVGAN